MFVGVLRNLGTTWPIPGFASDACLTFWNKWFVVRVGTLAYLSVVLEMVTGEVSLASETR